MPDNEPIIRVFRNARSRLDTKELVGAFCGDGAYHNMPFELINGKESCVGLSVPA